MQPVLVAHQLPRVRTRGQTNVDRQNRTLTRYDVLVWLTLAGVFTAYCVTMWAFSAWGLKMIKRLDRVKLTARAAAVFNNNKRPSMFDWTARRGVVERVTANKANVVVLWDGRKSMDVVPIRSVELESELGLLQTQHRL